LFENFKIVRDSTKYLNLKIYVHTTLLFYLCL